MTEAFRDDSRSEGAGSPPESGRTSSFGRLEDILRALPERELLGLIARTGVKIDPQKRIDVPAQTARALVGLPEIRDPSRLPTHSHELLLRVAERQGVLVVPTLPAGIELLMQRGILFAQRVSAGVRLVLAKAYLVQLPVWQGEDPRGARALISLAPFETVSAIATHYLGRPATPPIALALEHALDVLHDPARLQEEIEKLPPPERKLLESIEGSGGEVETLELLDLEREPLRLRGAKGISSGRRGVGFALERRGFLIPVHPNRHVVPSEVADVLGGERKRSSARLRASIRAHVLAEDHLPFRARFARDPAWLGLALSIAARESTAEVRPNVGTPRSLITKLAQRFGRPSHTIALLTALSRAVGLWEPSALSLASSPGSLQADDLMALLFAAWKKGGAWDEARPDGELLRAAPEQRDASPSRALRDMVIDALRDLGEEGWLPLDALERYLALDPRFEGVDRLLKRWSERVGLPVPAPALVIRRMLLESLPTLGLVDLGGESEQAFASLDESGSRSDPALPMAGKDLPAPPITLRVTSRGRALIENGAAPSAAPQPAKFLDGHVLRVGATSTTAHVLTLGTLVEIGRVEEGLDLIVTPQALSRAISGGAHGDEVRDRIEALAKLPDSLSQTLVQASVVVGRGSFVKTSGFLWVDDPDVREMLRTRRSTQDLFVDPSPPGGLLLAAEVDLDRLVRRCRGIGVEVTFDKEALRATADESMTTGRTQTPLPSRTSTPLPSRAATPNPSGVRIPRPPTIPPARSRTPFPRKS